MPKTAFKFRLYPTRAQETLLEVVLSTCREVYNSFLHWRKHDFELCGKSPSYYAQQDALPTWKKSHPELCKVQSQVLQNVCKRVDLAFESYFDRLKDYQTRKEQGRLKIVNDQVEKCPGPPRPKGKGSYDSLTYTQAAAFTVGEGCITFSKLATIKAVLHRPIALLQSQVTIFDPYLFRHQSILRLLNVGEAGFIMLVCLRILPGRLQQAIAKPPVRVGIDDYEGLIHQLGEESHQIRL